MYHDRNTNRKVNKIHKRTLRIANKDFDSNYEELMVKNNSFTIDQKNLQSFTIGIYKIKNNWNPVLMKEFLKKTHPYTPRSLDTVKLPRVE